eukprot:2141912-Rhodomonas_salina.3
MCIPASYIAHSKPGSLSLRVTASWLSTASRTAEASVPRNSMSFALRLTVCAASTCCIVPKKRSAPAPTNVTSKHRHTIDDTRPRASHRAVESRPAPRGLRGHAATWGWASGPQSARHQAQKAQAQREQVSAQQPSKSRKACEQRGQRACKSSSSTCFRAASTARPCSSILRSLSTSLARNALLSFSSLSTACASASSTRLCRYPCKSAGPSWPASMASGSGGALHSRGCLGQ